MPIELVGVRWGRTPSHTVANGAYAGNRDIRIAASGFVCDDEERVLFLKRPG